MTKFHRPVFCSPGVYAWVRTGGDTKAPLMGLLKLSILSSPGVNAWATEKLFKLGHYTRDAAMDRIGHLG
jgi:hypothetical protein